MQLCVPIDGYLADVAALLAVHAEDAGAEVPDARHRLLPLEVDHPEDGVVRAAHHEVVPPEILQPQ